MECLFCKIVKSELSTFRVWEDDNFLAILDIHPINPGHILLLPKSHFEDVLDMPNQLFSELFLTAKNIAKTLKAATSSKRVGLAIEGFGVPHVHVHLVPVKKGNELNPERAKPVSKSELEEMRRHLLNFFNNLD